MRKLLLLVFLGGCATPFVEAPSKGIPPVLMQKDDKCIIWHTLCLQKATAPETCWFHYYQCKDSL